MELAEIQIEKLKSMGFREEGQQPGLWHRNINNDKIAMT